MKLKKIDVKIHGMMHVDPDSVFVCPECGTDSVDGFDGEKVDFRESGHQKWVGETAFNDYYADIFTCHCDRCGCKWEEKRAVNKKKKWEVIIGFLAILFVVLMVILVCVFGGETPPKPIV